MSHSASKESLEGKLIIGNQYKLKKKIGSGSFGEIYQCVHVKTKEEAAVKLEKITVRLFLSNSL